MISDDILKHSIDFAPDPYGSHRFSMGFLRIPLILHRIPKDPIDFGAILKYPIDFASDS